MKNKWLFLVLTVVMTAALALCVACNSSASFSYKTYDTSDGDTAYNAKLYYRNDLLTVAPDPSVVRVKNADGSSTFYMYATSNEIACSGVQVWKSDDLNIWQCIGVAFTPEAESWCQRDIWAPEVLFYQGKYYMVFSGRNQGDPRNKLTLNMAVADKPEGPFIQWSGTNADGRVVTLADVWIENTLFSPDLPVYGEEMIDSHLFVDDDGQIYFYFCSTSDAEGSSIYGMKMKDMFTPDYDSAVQLLRTSRKNVDDEIKTLPQNDENYTNEGPFMLKHNGKYFLTFSVQSFRNKSYSVKQATGTSPLGKFTKVDVDKGGKFLTAIESDRTYVNESGETVLIDDYDQMSGTGHHCFLDLDGDVYILYHGHTDRVFGSEDRRAIAVDKVGFAVNSDGEEVIYVNGPTWSLQALPEAVSGYGNIAGKATVSATNVRTTSSEDYLNDGLIRMHNNSVVQDFVAEKGTTVTLEFDKYYNVTALMVYNSYYYDKLWKQIDSIKLYCDTSRVASGCYELKDLQFDESWNVDQQLQFVRAGGNVAVDFNELPVNKIEITINSDKPIAIGEIYVLGRELSLHTGDYKTEGYEISDVTLPTGYWRDFDLHEDVTLDGVPDESVWQENNWLEFNSPFDSNSHMRVTTLFGAEGIYFAAEVKDAIVSWNPNKAIWQNTSVELMFCPADVTEISFNVVQLRIGLNGTIEQYRGIYSGHGLANDGYRWTIGNYPAMVRTQGIGFHIDYLQPTVDQQNVGGYTLEAYVPYSAIGLTERPSSIRCIPSYNQVLSFESTNRTSNLPDGLPFDKVANYYTFNSYGVVYPAEGENLGSITGKRLTVGWDLSDDTENSAVALQTGGDQQYVFFKDLYAAKYYAWTYVTANRILGGDPYPKFGIINYNASNGLYYCVEASGLQADLDTLSVSGTIGSDNWNWSELAYSRLSSVLTGKYTGENAVKLGVLRDGSTFYFYVNDRYAGKRTDVSGFGAAADSYAGFLTMNIVGKFFDYGYTTDNAVLDPMIAELVGENLGDAPYGLVATGGFSLTSDRGEHASTTQTGSEQQYIFFKGLYSTKYMVTAKITVNAILNGDPSPKAGIIVAANGNNSVCLFIDPAGLTAGKHPVAVKGKVGTGDWEWNDMAWFNDYSTGSYTGDDYFTLTAVRDGDAFYFFLDGTYVGRMSGVSHLGENDKTTAGLLTMNAAAKYFDYAYSEDAAKIAALINDYVGENLGDAPFGQGATAGFSFADDRGDHPSTTQTGTEQQYVYFSDLYATRYVLTTKITVHAVLNGDPSPKVGIIAGATENTSVCLCIEPAGLTAGKHPCVMTGKVGTGDWNWSGMVWYNDASTGSYTGDDFLTFAAVRDGDTFYFFLDGAYLGQTKVSGISATDKTAAGFLTMNGGATYFDYDVSQEDADVDAYLSKVDL